VRLDTGADEGPRLMIYSNMYGMDKVRVLEGEVKSQFLELERQIKELQAKRNALIEENWDKMPALTWEWMKQHQDPSVQTPEPFKHKKAITALRRGSKVMVDASTDAVRWSSTWAPARRIGGLACKVGKLRKKGPKYAVVEIEGKLFRIPYYVLLPYGYQEWLREKRKIKDSKRLVKMSNAITRQLNKIL